MEPVEVLAMVGGHVDQELLLRNQYLALENEILRTRVTQKIKFTPIERQRLAQIGKELGQKALIDVATIVKPETILRWFRELVAKKYDGSKNRKQLGRPATDLVISQHILRIARENRTWGYDKIQGALANIGYQVSDQTVANILKKNGLPPRSGRVPEMSWADFIRNHQDTLYACDFFTADVFTPAGLVTYYVLFFSN
jgi:putative transposase